MRRFWPWVAHRTGRAIGLTAAAGLPLAVAEIGRRTGSSSTPLDSRDVAAFLPSNYTDYVASLPAPVAEAVLYVAICNELRVLRLLGISDLGERLRQAEEAGVILSATGGDDGRVGFRHPLLQAAVLAANRADRERAAHRTVATALKSIGLDDRAALHLASAAHGPDEEAADALSALAERCRVRGALAESAHACVRAASLYVDPDLASALLTRAADAFFDGGNLPGAFDAVDRAIVAAVDPATKADAQSLRAKFTVWVVSPVEMIRGLDDVARAMRPIDQRRAATALAAAAGMGYLTGDLTGSIRRSTEAELLATASGDFITAIGATGARAWSEFLAGDVSTFDERIAPVEALMHELLEKRTWAGVHMAELFCLTWICAERWDDAEPVVRKLVYTTRTMGSRLSASSTTLMLGSLCWRRGRWDEAYALERPLLDQLDIPPVTLCWMQALFAQLTASMGLEEETRELVALSLPVATAAEVPMVAAIATAALGHLELSLGNNEEALVLLDRTAELADRAGLEEPEYFLWLGDYFDALFRAGRTEEVADRVTRLAKFADEFGRRWAKGVVSRARAQLTNDPAESQVLFDEALWAFEDLGMPFEVARTLLTRGSQPGHGSPQDMADARRLFLRLGAKTWASSAQAVPGAKTPAGAVAGSPSADAGNPFDRIRVLERLSPSERNVALGVAAGRTNREIAAELHLSPKTIDHYLQSAFRKVGVRNRTELATTLAKELAAP